jgi:hypothetical protein
MPEINNDFDTDPFAAKSVTELRSATCPTIGRLTYSEVGIRI